MDHNSIVATLESLMPDIAKTGDPSGVMLKYASENNLAPAQLTRLGQYFNVGKTLAHFRKSAAEDRGKTFPTIDTVALEEAYTGKTKTEELKKKAAAMEDPGLQKAASAPKVRDGGRIGFEFPTLAKEAAEVVVQNETPVYEEYPAAKFNCQKAMQMKFASDEYMTELREIRQEAFDKFASLVRKVEDRVREIGDFGIFAKMEESVYAMLGESGRETMNKIASKLADRLPITRMTDQTAVDVRTYFNTSGDQFSVCDYVKEASVCLEVIEEATKEAATQTGPPPIYGLGDYELGKSPVEDKDYSRPVLSRPANLHGARKEQRPRDKDKSGGGDGKGTVSALLSSISGKGDVLDPLWGVVGKPSDTAGILGAIGGGSNRKLQANIDDDINDITMSTNVRRLMSSDPIISTYPPDQVVSIFSTLMNANPEIAQDHGMLRMALREALAYEAPSMSMYKTLIEADKTRQDARRSETDVKDRVYGGGKPSSGGK